ncbi:MAG TPA: hypothetical protein VHC20_03600 [Candidatus Paceibacterota bacterium]|nr:hypothetical protein [Candidatus Paceibacterota bacterium]
MFVIVDGKKIPVEEFEGSSVDEERAAHARHKLQRRLDLQRNGGGMQAGAQFLRGDPRRARKNFRMPG